MRSRKKVAGSRVLTSTSIQRIFCLTQKHCDDRCVRQNRDKPDPITIIIGAIE